MASRTPSNLVSLPSLSSSLHSLPHATSLSSVALHPNMYASRAAESEAKLQKVLDRQAASLGSQSQAQTPVVPAYMMPPPANASDSSSPLMMRRKKFTM